jgi:hypothetical protein
VDVPRPALPDQIGATLVPVEVVGARRLELEFPIPPWTDLHSLKDTIFILFSSPL